MPFRPTTLGKFYLYEKLAVGGMAEIFKAKLYGTAGFEKTLVVKLILPEYANDDEFVKMFIDEANIAVSLNHGNIVSVYELGQIGDRYYMAMEFVDGENLETIIERWQEQGNGPLPLWHSVFIASEVCKGLDFAHKKTDAKGASLNIVHRDISPQNVMVSFDGEVKIVDFGIAKAASKLSATRVGTIKGKFEYMSPEQAYGDEVDGRADVYSLGIVLWEMITGRPLFTGESEIELLRNVRDGKIPAPRSINPAVPKELEMVIAKALQRDAAARFGDAAQFHAALSRLLYGDAGLTGERSLAEFMRALFAKRVSAEPVVQAQPRQLSEHAEEKTVTFAVGEMFRSEALDAVPVDGIGDRTTVQGVRAGAIPQPRFSAEETTASRNAVPDMGVPPSEEITANRDPARSFDEADSSARMVVGATASPGTISSGEAAVVQQDPGSDETTNRHVSLSDMLEPGPIAPKPSRPSAETELGPVADVLPGNDVETEARELELEVDESSVPPPTSGRKKVPVPPPSAAPLPAVKVGKDKKGSVVRDGPAEDSKGTLRLLIILVPVLGGIFLALLWWGIQNGLFRGTSRPTPGPSLRVPTPTEPKETTPPATEPVGSTPTPAAVTTRTLNVSTTPGGAIVVANDIELGLSPIVGEQMPRNAAVTVEVSKSGYRSFKHTYPAGDDVLNVTVTLKRTRRPPPTPRPAGTKTPGVRHTPAPTPAANGGGGMGTLILNADPWATVYIDGVKIKNTPILGYKLSAGTHKIKLVNSELNVTKELKVDIKAGEPTREIVNMRE